MQVEVGHISCSPDFCRAFMPVSHLKRLRRRSIFCSAGDGRKVATPGLEPHIYGEFHVALGSGKSKPRSPRGAPGIMLKKGEDTARTRTSIGDYPISSPLTTFVSRYPPQSKTIPS